MRRIVLTSIVLALVLPATAGAQTVPPGNSGVDQYQESVPGIGGSQPSGPNGPGIGNTSGTKPSGSGQTTGENPTGTAGVSRISPATARSLDKLGPDGKATDRIAEATAPSNPSSPQGGSSDSGPGMGWALPVILVLALLAALSIVVLRWRRGVPPDAA